jgi:NAD(P)-dependent dehydrogenase (short-subunit alcohol dehydrogenase family)
MDVTVAANGFEPPAAAGGPVMPANVLITGAARRVGRGIAADLARHGWGVAVHYGNSAGEAHELVDQLQAGGARALAVQADLACEGEVALLVERAARGLGPLTCLVNNASIFEDDSALGATRASWDRHMEINLRAPFVLTQSFARQLPRGAGGNVVNIIDERVWNLTPHFVSYTLSKSALWTLTQTLALALAPAIRVNAIGPGPVLPSHYQSPASFERLCAAMPLRRGTSPAEIASVIRFLVAAPSVTGQMIALDGGQHLGWIFPEGECEQARA